MVMIQDGVYFLFPEGSAWIGARFRNGRLVDRTEECLAATHRAAGDEWAGYEPIDEDEELDAVQADPIIREVMGPDVHVEMVVVTRCTGDF